MRGTGRTTRMLERAVDLAVGGTTVYVVCASNKHAIELRATFNKRWPNIRGVKFESSLSLTNLDWATLRLRSAHPNVEVVVDHYAIESKFQLLLEELHRYDL